MVMFFYPLSFFCFLRGGGGVSLITFMAKIFSETAPKASIEGPEGLFWARKIDCREISEISKKVAQKCDKNGIGGPSEDFQLFFEKT